MKKHIFLIIILVLGIGMLSAQKQTMNMETANKLYSSGNYADAAAAYEQIASTQGVAPELYYNLGNAYYKENEIGKAILNFERALRLDATFEDAKYNLAVAQAKVIDNIPSGNGFFLMKWIDNLIGFQTSNNWFWLSFIALLICLLASFIFIFGSNRSLRKLAFYIGAVLLALCVVSGTFSAIGKHRIMSHSHAIIMSGIVTVKSSPDKSGTDLFQLHEGTKVEVKSNLGEWTEIELSNGSIGWLPAGNIEKI